jgi:hypothetical protein
MVGNVAVPSFQTTAALENMFLPSFELSQKIGGLTAYISNLNQAVENVGLSTLRFNQMVESITFQSFQPVIQDLLATSLQLRQGLALKSLAIDNLASIVGSIQTWMPPNFRRLKDAIRNRLLYIFQLANLWPTPSMSEEFIDQIDWLAGRGDLHSAKQVVRLVWNYYAQNNHARLEMAIINWWDDPEYLARSRIIKRAFQNHQLRWYETSIPALLAQVEGISSDFVYHSDYSLKSANGSKLELGSSTNVVQRTLEVLGGLESSNIDAMDIQHLVMIEAAVLYIQNVSYKYTKFKPQYYNLRDQHDLSRHGVLHGIQIKYSSPMNSLRCFLLLDAIYGARKFYRRLNLNDNS